MKEERYHIALDKYDKNIVINALNTLRTRQLQEERPTDPVDELIDKCPVLADFKAVKDGNVWCTTNDMYQQSMSIGYMIKDIHSMLCDGDEDDMTYLFKLVN